VFSPEIPVTCCSFGWGPASVLIHTLIAAIAFRRRLLVYAALDFFRYTADVCQIWSAGEKKTRMSE
jgi:hypothetical protein